MVLWTTRSDYFVVNHRVDSVLRIALSRVQVGNPRPAPTWRGLAPPIEHARPFR